MERKNILDKYNDIIFGKFNGRQVTVGEYEPYKKKTKFYRDDDD